MLNIILIYIFFVLATQIVEFSHVKIINNQHGCAVSQCCVYCFFFWAGFSEQTFACTKDKAASVPLFNSFYQNNYTK